MATKEVSCFRLIDFENGTPTIIKDDEAFMIKCFREIITRDKGMMGDHDGRKKFKAAKELGYIIFMKDSLRSPGIRAGKFGAELNALAIKELDLPEGWVADELIYECFDAYDKYIDGVANDIYKNLLKSMSNTNKVVEIINDKIAAKLRDGIADSEIKDVTNNINTLIGIAAQYENQVDSLKRAEYKSKEERKDIIKSKGGKVIVPSMDPSNAVK